MNFNDKIRDRYINFLTDLKKEESKITSIKRISSKNGINVIMPVLLKTNLISAKKEGRGKTYRILKCNYKIPVEPIDARLLYEAMHEDRKKYYKPSENKTTQTTPFINIEPMKKKNKVIPKIDNSTSKLLNEISKLKIENEKLKKMVLSNKRIRFQFPIKFQSIFK